LLEGRMTRRTNPSALVETQDLRVYFYVREGFLSRRREVRAVDGVNLSIAEGEVLGLIGESGSGKTTLGRVLALLTAPTSGRVLFKGKDVSQLGKEEYKVYRRKIQMVFQDPYESLNPNFSVFMNIIFPLKIHGVRDRGELREDCSRLLGLVGLDPSEFMDKYPHQLSGGEKQRVSIARALALEPEFIVADEPVSMLDMSIRSSVLNLLMDLKESQKLTYLFITHDMHVARYVSDRIAVMYLGRILEIAEEESLLRCPLHPYTHLLISAAGRRSVVGPAAVPAEAPVPAAGCRFYPRCWRRLDRCGRELPELEEVERGHGVACFNPCEWPAEPAEALEL